MKYTSSLPAGLCLALLAIIAGTALHAQSALSSWPANSYLKVLDAAECGKKLYVSDASHLGAGDWVLLIQTRGARGIGEDCGRYGRVEDYGGAGNIEIVRVDSINANPGLGDEYVVLQECPSLFYYAAYPGTSGIPGHNDYGYQIVKVQFFDNDVIVDGDLNADVWNPVTGVGGVIALASTGTITLKADIDVSGKGFAGGSPNSNDNSDADQSAYFYDPGDNKAGEKGKGIVEPLSLQGTGRGASGNGGGGGNGKNSGGGGGGNYGAGGLGGNQNEAEGGDALGGVGGYAMGYDVPECTRAIFGGGGGGGHRSAKGTAQGESAGGAGGGLVLIICNELVVDRAIGEGTGVDRKILANGLNGGNAQDGDNGAGGGGAGGVVLLDVGSVSIASFQTNLDLIIEARGGQGGNTNVTTTTLDCSGPGGGGGGGTVWYRSLTAPSAVQVNVSGGSNGTAVNCGNAPHGAESGEAGAEKFNLTVPVYYDDNETPI